MKVFLFGEAEKGDFCAPLPLRSLLELSERFGQPPTHSMGIHYAVQALLYKRELLYYRVHEEGFSLEDYQRGVKRLYIEGKKLGLSAICTPGLGDQTVIEALTPICLKLKCLFILSEKDLYDYLTESKY